MAARARRDRAEAADHARRAAQPDLAAALDAAATAAYAWDLASDRLTWSAGAQALLGVADPAAIATGAAFARLVDPEAMTDRHTTIRESAERDQGEGVVYRIVYPLKGVGGRRLWIEDHGRWFAGADGRPARAEGLLRDVTARHAAEQELALIARHDPLTGQLNRQRLLEVLDSALDDARRVQGSIAFVLTAIENLAALNDLFGFEVVDEVILEVARRIRASMRGRDALGRYSSSTLGMVLTACDASDLQVAAQRFIATVHEAPVATSAGPILVRISVAGVVAPRHAATAAEALSAVREALADVRMHRRGTFLAFEPDADRLGRRRRNAMVVDELLALLNERRLAIALQPIVEAQTGETAWHEALMRSVRNGDVSSGAGEIIEAAERLGLVALIDARALELAVAALEGDPALKLAINVSAASLVDPTLREALTARLATRPDLAGRLMVEITETVAIRETVEARAFVALVRGFGAKVAVDDFGSGHSSFRVLRELGVDVVKIDGSFVAHVATSPDDRAFVRALVGLARDLGLKTVAEQVEDEATAETLRDLGVDYLQGDAIGRPTTTIDHAPHGGNGHGHRDGK